MTAAAGPNQRLLIGLGAIGGLLVGLIVSVNIVIYGGPDTGYESSIGSVFAETPLTGVLAVAALVGGPIMGVLAARRLNRPRRT